MRRVTNRAAFRLQRRVLVSEWTLFIGVTLNACCISAGGESGLLEFKSTVRIVTIAALHGSFQHLMMEGRTKRRLDLTVTAQAELRLTAFQHVDG